MDEWILACRTLEAAGVRYVIVGAFGAELHMLRAAGPITTRDMDLLLPPDVDQVQRALDSLGEAGFAFEANGAQVIVDDVTARGAVRQGATLRALRGHEVIDLMTQAAGLGFEDAWRAQQEYVVRGVPLRVAPLDAILRSKKEAGRTKDRLFLEQFREQIAEALERETRRQQPEAPRG